MPSLDERRSACEASGRLVFTVQVFNDGRNSFGMTVTPTKLGLEVSNLRPHGIAALSGIVRGDVLLSIAGNSDLASEAALFKWLRSFHAGQVVEVIYARQRSSSSSIAVGQAGDSQAAVDVPPAPSTLLPPPAPSALLPPAPAPSGSPPPALPHSPGRVAPATPTPVSERAPGSISYGQAYD